MVFVNGVFTSKSDAKQSLDDLRDEFNKESPGSKITFINGYNPSHLAGLGDLVQSAAQMMGTSISNFDRDTILLQIHPQVTTRKLLLVGHSQGAFYSNALFDYLLAHGEPKAAVGVYQVGSPASSVAGGGKYLNSSGDSVLGTLRGLGFTFLASNIDLVPSADDAQTTYPGHLFSSAYLAEAPERIVGDIQSTLKDLKADWATDTGECFTAPDDGLGYQATKTGFVVADSAANGIKAGASAAQVAAVAAGNVLAAALQGAYGAVAKVATDIGITAGGVAGISHAAEPKAQPTNFDILKKLYGSSLTKEDYKELLGNQGSAVATAPTGSSAPAPQTQPQPTPDTPAPHKITYLGSSHHQASSEPQEESVEAAVQAIEPATTTPDSAPPADTPTTTPAQPATTTVLVLDPATTTPPVVVPTGVPALSPVTDSFDSYNGSGWTPFGGGSPITLLATTSPECHSGSCIFTGEEIGNGGFGNAKRMYKTGTPVSEGSLVIWKKYHAGFQGVGGVQVRVCVSAPDPATGGTCDGLINGSISGSPDIWHEYYLAWRNNGDAKEFCRMTDDTDQSHCIWQASSVISAGQAPDTVVIAGDAIRPDLGDRLWFDDLDTP